MMHRYRSRKHKLWKIWYRETRLGLNSVKSTKTLQHGTEMMGYKTRLQRRPKTGEHVRVINLSGAAHKVQMVNLCIVLHFLRTNSCEILDSGAENMQRGTLDPSTEPLLV